MCKKFKLNDRSIQEVGWYLIDPSLNKLLISFNIDVMQTSLHHGMIGRSRYFLLSKL